MHRLYPEVISYILFINGLYLLFLDYQKKFLVINLLFALSVLLRPNLILTVIFLSMIKMIKERQDLINVKNFIILTIIFMIYLLPLFHNLYFANSYTLFIPTVQRF